MTLVACTSADRPPLGPLLLTAAAGMQCQGVVVGVVLGRTWMVKSAVSLATALACTAGMHESAGISSSASPAHLSAEAKATRAKCQVPSTTSMNGVQGKSTGNYGLESDNYGFPMGFLFPADVPL